MVGMVMRFVLMTLNYMWKVDGSVQKCARVFPSVMMVL